MDSLDAMRVLGMNLVLVLLRVVACGEHAVERIAWQQQGSVVFDADQQVSTHYDLNGQGPPSIPRWNVWDGGATTAGLGDVDEGLAMVPIAGSLFRIHTSV